MDPRHSTNYKSFKTIGEVIACVLVLVIVGYVFFARANDWWPTSPSQDGPHKEEPFPIFPVIDVSNWQTYRNEKYGFEFKYPQGVMFDNRNGSEQLNGVVVYLPLDYPANPLGYHGFDVFVTNAHSNDLQKECTQPDQNPLIAGSMVGNVRALEYDSNEHPESNPPDHVLCVMYHNKIYKVSYDIYDGVTLEMISIYQAMMESFKFTN